MRRNTKKLFLHLRQDIENPSITTTKAGNPTANLVNEHTRLVVETCVIRHIKAPELIMILCRKAISDACISRHYFRFSVGLISRPSARDNAGPEATPSH
ncbi:hypothetical protein EVAR_25660_1 [Eumeta japonica]|uniref:Uncharacterized protein n=1 Tax=Eumeta variegata TaxID=151549 RepID=A0A4C1WDH2_EUMVA|nr:hypothetical protein EVAR_25660_1 [Eumeta japonica]